MPKVSVIIPNYNHARFLEQRIQSILDQTFQDFDLTYLDDASSDDSNDVFAKFDCQPRIKAIYNQQNSGSPFKQWNKGVRATTGEYIWIAESDDVADPTFLDTLVPLLDQNPQVGLAYCQSRQIDSNNVVVLSTLRQWAEDLSQSRWSNDFIANGFTECQQYLLFNNNIPNASAVLIRRSVYEAIGGAEESMFFAGDWMTWLKILLKSDLAFSAQILNSFRSHESSVSSRSFKSKVGIYEHLLVIYNLKVPLEISLETLSDFKKRMLCNWIDLTFNPDSKVSLKDQIKFYMLAAKTFDNVNGIVLREFAAHLKRRSIGQIKRWASRSA
ncbi:glycosyltransferase family 2 protein [Chamaesiphon polymorphus]|nr:glycosyltransferase [Chamaesiphon polymorphus]